MWVFHLKSPAPKLDVSLSPHKSVLLSHNPTQGLQTPRSFSCLPSLRSFLSVWHRPPSFYVDTVQKQVSDSERQARRERSASVLLRSPSLWREILPWHKESSIFCVRKHLRPFLVAAVPAPLTQPYPPGVFPPMVLNPFIALPLLLMCPCISLKASTARKNKTPPKW